MDWWISSKYSCRILLPLLANPPKDILKHPTGMAAHEKCTCTGKQTVERCVRMDWWISSKCSCRIPFSLLAKPPKDILKPSREWLRMKNILVQ